MPHSRKPSTAVGDHIELVAYLRRKPDITRAQFYNHWQNVHARKVAPWAEKHGVISYKQMHTHGTIIPNNIGAPLSSSNSSDDIATSDDLVQPVKFDGIAVWEITSIAAFEDALKDEYYANTLEVDEREFLDKAGLGGGVVARFQGKVWSVLERGKSVVKKDVGQSEMNIWSRLSTGRELISMQDERPMF